MKRTVTRRGITLIATSVAVGLVLFFSFSSNISPAKGYAKLAAPLCGNGSAPDYGFNYDLQQTHWTVNWQGYASEQAVSEVDTILDRLDSDSIVQTMILIQPQAQVGNRVNCAVHFLRYMQLGLPDGERKDNGFVFLIVVEPGGLDVHYGVGLGLPALTAAELSPLNRVAEEAYSSTQNIDRALLTLVQGFDAVARSNYAPLVSLNPTPQPVDLPVLPSGPLGILTLCGLLCMGIVLIFFMIWMLPKLARSGISISPYGSGARGSGFPFGGGRGGSSTRGGGGSGRSGRGN